MALTIHQIDLADANAFVALHHRHHKPVVGHRLSIGVYDDGRLAGVAIIGRPVGRMVDAWTTIEVTRTCTDGTKNASSKLYGAAARIAKELGYEKIQTYLLDTEDGASLKAAGWVREGPAGGGQWKRPGDWSNPAQAVLFQRNRTDQPTCGKVRWAKWLTKRICMEAS